MDEEFGYEKLDVYQRSIEFLSHAYALVDCLPKGYSSLADQLRRSSLSVPLNIAEATGKSSSAERKRFYQIAKGSALECSAIINCCITLNLADNNRLLVARSLTFRIVQMLSKLVTR